VPPVNLEISDIGRPNFAAFSQFAHAHKASIGKVHGPVGVFLKQRKHLADMICQTKIQDDVAAGDQLAPQTRVSNQESQFIENSFAGVERSMRAELVTCPLVVLVRFVEQRLEQAGISDSFHAWRARVRG